jgi:hypothetical protein
MLRVMQLAGLLLYTNRDNCKFESPAVAHSEIAVWLTLLSVSSYNVKAKIQDKDRWVIRPLLADGLPWSWRSSISFQDSPWQISLDLHLQTRMLFVWLLMKSAVTQLRSKACLDSVIKPVLAWSTQIEMTVHGQMVDQGNTQGYVRWNRVTMGNPWVRYQWNGSEERWGFRWFDLFVNSVIADKATGYTINLLYYGRVTWDATNEHN